MSPPPSLLAQASDLLGDVPGAADERRPTVKQALRRCAPGDVRAARLGTREMVVFRLADGRAFAAPDHCPHDGGRLSDGFVDGGMLVCARHQWEFDACTGECPGRAAAIEVAPVQLRRRRG